MTEETPKSDSAPLADPFASAKTNLRDTVKWLATTFAAVSGVILTGTSFSGLSRLSGWHLPVAALGAALAFFCLVIATGVMLRLLTSESFYLSDLRRKDHATLLHLLDSHAVDILPAGIKDIETLLSKRDDAVRDFRANNANAAAATTYLTDLRGPMSMLTNLAQFEQMRARLEAAQRRLFVLALLALIGLFAFAVSSGGAKEAAPAAPAPVTNIVGREPFMAPNDASRASPPPNSPTPP
jgi:hypothetical protein